MTRKEAEKAIYEKLLEVREIFEEFCPEDSYLTMTILTQDSFYPSGITFNNSYYGVDDIFNNHRLYFPETHLDSKLVDSYDPAREEQ